MWCMIGFSHFHFIIPVLSLCGNKGSRETQGSHFYTHGAHGTFPSLPEHTGDALYHRPQCLLLSTKFPLFPHKEMKIGDSIAGQCVSCRLWYPDTSDCLLDSWLLCLLSFSFLLTQLESRKRCSGFLPPTPATSFGLWWPLGMEAVGTRAQSFSPVPPSPYVSFILPSKKKKNTKTRLALWHSN